MYYVGEIKRQLFILGRMKVWSWGAHAWTKIDEYTLQFKVQGHHFNGYVRIEYCYGKDLYNIHFGKWRADTWITIKSVEDIYFDVMVDIIDEEVEYIPAYRDR